MAQKLSVQIQLEGAAEIERQLAGIGKAGQQCFADITKAAEQAGGFAKLDPTAIADKFKQLGITAPAEIKKITAAVQQVGNLEATVLGVANLERGFGSLAQKATAAFGLTRQELGGLRAGLRQLDIGAIGNQLTALGRVGGVFGPIGIGITGVGAAVAIATKAMIGFAESISKVSAEAISLGLNIEQFDRLRLGLEGAGFGAQAVSDGVARLKGELDLLDVKKLVQLLSLPSGTAFKGTSVGGIPTGEFQKLKDAALGFGAAAELARASLEKFGIVNFNPLEEAFKRLGVAAGPVQERLPDIIKKLEEMPDSVLRTNIAFTILGQKLGTELIQALKAGGVEWDLFKAKFAGGAFTADQENAATRLQQALNRLTAEWNRFGSLTVAPQLTAGINAVTASLEVLGGVLVKLDWSAFGLGARLVLNPFVTLTQLATAAIAELAGKLGSIPWSDMANSALAVIQRVLDGFGLMGAKILEFASLVLGFTWDPIAAGVAVWNAVTAAIGRAIDAVLRFFGIRQQATAAPSGGDGGDGGLPHASGGLIGGRGTGTSDSNLAWLSRGEYVTPARAVAQPGVLAFLEALRRSGGDLRHVLDGMGRFALGGMVMRSAIPAFASGGLNGGGSRVLNLTIEGRSFSGLSVPENTAQALERFAVHSQIASAGRKPSWRR